MIKRVLLFFSLMLLLSCGGGNEISFSENSPPDDNGYGDFIQTEFRESFLTLREKAIFYHIRLFIDRSSRHVDGNAEIRWTNNGQDSLDELKFRFLLNNKHNRPMSLKEIISSGHRLTGRLSDDGTILTVPLEKPLDGGDNLTLKISYEIDYNNPPDNYFDFDRIDEKGFSLAHFYPIAVPRSRGIWEDTPLYIGGDLLNADSSWFFVEVETDKKVTVAASGRELDRQRNGSRQLLSYGAGPVRDFYLCGSTDFFPESISNGETVIQSFAPSSMRDQGRRAIAITSRALDLFGREFGAYPFTELKIAVLPMSALGIEFPAFFAIGENICRDNQSYLFEPTVVHEAAHQWFYSLVGNNQLTAPWIDEGFAQYATWYFLKEQYGKAGADGMYNSFLTRWDRIGRKPIPIGKPVSFYSRLEYGAVIYGRAPLFFIDAERLIGEKKFHNFLKQTVREYSNRRIDSETFLELLGKTAGSGLDPLIEEYF